MGGISMQYKVSSESSNYLNRFGFPVGMANFRDPAIVTQDFCAYTLPSFSGFVKPNEPLCPLTVVLVKFWHAVDGAFM